MKKYNDGLKRIAIPDELGRYIGYWVHVRNQFDNVVYAIDHNRSYFISNMTKDEFDDSYAYIKYRYEEACAAIDSILETVHEMFSDILKAYPFDIDVIDNYVVYNDSGSPVNISEKLRQWHRSDNYSYGDSITRLYHDQQKVEMKIGGSHVMDITLQVTDDCNMNCSYCYQHNKGHNKMSFETAKQFIDMMLSCNDQIKGYINTDELLGVILDFIGGEPLLEINLIYKISLYFVKELFRLKHHLLEVFIFSMTSNGLNYFEDRVQEYINAFRGLVSIGITVDGNKELHDMCRVDLGGNGTYDRAIAASLDVMRRVGDDRTKITISPQNVKYLKTAITDLVGKGYRGIHANCAFEKGWEIEHAQILYHQLIELVDWMEENDLFKTVTISLLDRNHCKPLDPSNNRNWCGGAGLMAAVSPAGNIYPCLRFMESSLGDQVEPYIIGTVEHGIGATDIEKNRIDLLGSITRRSQSTDECFNCPIAAGCSWCTAYNYEVFGTPNARATFICCMHKARALATAYYVRKRYDKAIMHCPLEYAIPIISENDYNELKAFVEGGE